MSVFEGVVDFLSGGIGGKVVDKVFGLIPERLSDKEKADIQMAITEATREYEMGLIKLAQEEQEEFDTRIREMEGTAKDLQQFGFFGKLIVFLRGSQRPVWGFGVLVLDYMVFSGSWKLSSAAQAAPSQGPLTLESAFWMINFLVLGFTVPQTGPARVI